MSLSLDIGNEHITVLLEPHTSNHENRQFAWFNEPSDGKTISFTIHNLTDSDVEIGRNSSPNASGNVSVPGGQSVSGNFKSGSGYVIFGNTTGNTPKKAVVIRWSVAE